MNILRTSATIRPRSNRWLTAAISVAATLAAGPWSAPVFGQSVGLTALTTFGSNGWLYPGTTTSGTLNQYVAGSNTYRGMAWNPVTKNLVLPVVGTTTGTTVAILSGSTGATVKTMNATGVTGGTVLMAGAGVDDDGQIYVCNVAASSASTYKIYKWGNESSTLAPTLAYTKSVQATTSGTFRFGDAFAVYGSGANARFATAGSTATGTTSGSPNNSNFMYGTLDSSTTSTIYYALPAPDATANNYRLGIAFLDSDTIIGTYGTRGLTTDFVGTSSVISTTDATISGTIPFPTASSRFIDSITLRGTTYLAVGDSSSNVVRVLDISSPASPVTIASLTLTTSTASNANGSGAMAWGDVSIQDGFWFSATLYSMNTNNGIQAMVFTVPEPATLAVLPAGVAACGGGAYLRSRSRRRRRAA